MPPFHSFEPGPGPVVVTAIHAGHDLSSQVAERCALRDPERLREEDPFTDRFIPEGTPSIVVHRSRFEVDLNRPRERAVYRGPDDAWGMSIWKRPLREEEVTAALRSYDAFYAEVAEDLDARAAAGPFVVLDLHAYNHRRSGPDAPPAPGVDNPEINVGTRWPDRARRTSLIEGFEADLASATVAGHHPDVRENVKFKGGNFSQWINARYAGRGRAIAVEFKKVYMDEWSGAVDVGHVADLADAVSSTLPALHERLVSAA